MIFQRWDGTMIGSSPNLEPAQGLFTATLGIGRITQIWPFTSDQRITAGWAPSGRAISMTENANHHGATRSANIATMRPDGSGLQLLTTFHDPQKNAYFGSYSPDGQWLIYRMEAHGPVRPLPDAPRRQPPESHHLAVHPQAISHRQGHPA